MVPFFKQIHHLTACTSDARQDIEFFTKIVGQRLIKKTLTYGGGDPFYHLYFGDELGTPGTIMTTFPTKHFGRGGRKGAGQVRLMSYSVPTGSLAWWDAHLTKHKVEHTGVSERFGEKRIHFTHPSDLEFELVEDGSDQRKPWLSDAVPVEFAVRGFHSVTLWVNQAEQTVRFLKDAIGMTEGRREGAYIRLHSKLDGPASLVDLFEEPNAIMGSWTYGEGTVHHVAFAVQGEPELLALRDHFIGQGYTDSSEVKNRGYFKSIYVRAPGGTLIETATCDLGFTVDESAEDLGKGLFIPPKYRDDPELLKKLEPLDDEVASKRTKGVAETV